MRGLNGNYLTKIRRKIEADAIEVEDKIKQYEAQGFTIVKKQRMNCRGLERYRLTLIK